MSTPALLDRAGVREHYGLTRVDVERVFAVLPVVRLPDSRKVYIRSSDLDEHLSSYVFRPGERVRA